MLSERRFENNMVKVGVFWIYRKTVVGRAIDLETGEEGVPGLIDSPDNHADLWEKVVLGAFPELCDHQYFDIPRGRVLWDANNERAIVYLDASLNAPEIRAEIARFFDLYDDAITWRSDAHYNTNKEALNKLFSDT
jgi:hypothetical protein